MSIRFNKPYVVGTELDYVRDAISSGRLAGNGRYTRRCQQWLQDYTGAKRVILCHSCTAALEIAALLADVGPGDEVLMPSFTFVSTANAFALRGATPVFVDIRPDTLNIDEKLIEQAITPHTKAIVPVHYAGVGCEMDAILAMGAKHELLVIEDAAQGLGAYTAEKHLGTIGDMGTLSFQETKNVQCGEGGALLLNDERFSSRAEIIWEKGTDRSAFGRGEVAKYTWLELGSSYPPGELVAAFLLAQLEATDAINEQRVAVWNEYHRKLEPMAQRGLLQRPVIPKDARPNGHIYYVILPTAEHQCRVLSALKAEGIGAVFHYVPLHSSPAGLRYGRPSGSLAVTEGLSARLVRLPLWPGLTAVDKIVKLLEQNLIL